MKEVEAEEAVLIRVECLAKIFNVVEKSKT
jgi:hypothetical protein